MRRPGPLPASPPSPARIARLCRGILGALPAEVAADPHAAAAVTAAVDAFLTERGDPERAALAVAEVFDDAGARLAHAEYDSASLAQMFQAAHVALQKGLRPVVDADLTHDQLVALREHLVAFVNRLAGQTVTGHRRTAELLSMSDAERLARLRRAAFGDSSPVELERLARSAGRDPHERVTVIVSTGEPLPAELLEHPDVLAGRGGVEMLVPQRWNLASLDELLDGQAVAGPPAELREATSAIGLSRRAADLLSSGRVQDSRLLVPYSDLLADLVVQGNPLLADLIVDKHLRPLERLSVSRRLKLGEVLLHSLESGLPTNQLARDLGIPTQTAHSRMKTLRSLLGDILDDPTQRLELIIALRAALPRWRSDAD